MFSKNMKIRFYKIQRILKTNTYLKNMTGQRANTLIFALNIIKPDIFFQNAKSDYRDCAKKAQTWLSWFLNFKFPSSRSLCWTNSINHSWLVIFSSNFEYILTRNVLSVQNSDPLCNIFCLQKLLFRSSYNYVSMDSFIHELNSFNYLQNEPA